LLAFAIGTLAACSGSSRANPAQSASPTVPPQQTATTTKAPTGSSSGATADPCTLLSADQVSAVLGGAVDIKGPAETGGGRNCTFERSDGSGAHVLVQVFKGAQYFSPAQQATAPEPIPGVGDASFLDSPDGQPRMAGYRTGDTVVFLSVLFANPTKDQLIGLTKDTLAKL
jgi:hypothetical protein